jgi:membrane-associated phospholipid phosphatase
MRRLQSGVVLGLTATSAAGFFVKIAEDVTMHESNSFDRATSLFLHRFDTPVLDIIMRAFTLIGSFPAIAVVAVAVLIWCWRRGDLEAFTALIAVIAADEALNFYLKHLFERPRPDLFSEIAALHTYSFPSGHAMAAVAIYGMIAVVIARLEPRLRLWIFAGVVPIILLIGLSRIYLGVHWITDVLAGYAAGSTLLFAALLWLNLRGATARQTDHSGKSLPTQQC